MPVLDRDIELFVSESSRSRKNEKARVGVGVTWNEGDENHQFLLRAFLYEEEGKKDTFSVANNGMPVRRSSGASDDLMGEIGQITLRGGRPGSRIRRSLEREWNFPRTGEHFKEYFAIATLVPLGVVGQIRVGSKQKSQVG